MPRFASDWNQMRPITLATLVALCPVGVLAAPDTAPQAPASKAVSSPFRNQASTTIRGLVEPRLSLAPAEKPEIRVALTFDACSGRTDTRILDVLVKNRIPATIFVTARWLRRNADAVAVLKANADLFEVENHGAAHVPAVDRPGMVYGIRAAGSVEGVETEAGDGARALVANGFRSPQWFRGATARYTPSSMEEIGRLGYRVAGFSLNGDDGASVSATTAERRLAAARDGDVIIAHINQPGRAAGAGIAKGILALKAKGVTFVRLSDAAEEAGTRTDH